jgi:hypothetical protein
MESLNAQAQQARFALAATHIHPERKCGRRRHSRGVITGQIDATRELTTINTDILQTLRNQYAAGYASELDVAGQELALAQVAATRLKQLAQ